MNVTLLYSLILASAFNLAPANVDFSDATKNDGNLILSPCLEAAATTLVRQISNRTFSDANCEPMDDGIRLADGRFQTQVKLTWNAKSPQPGNYWLTGNFILGDLCQNIQWKTIDNSPNLKPGMIPNAVEVAGFEPQRGMGLGRRPIRLSAAANHEH